MGKVEGLPEQWTRLRTPIQPVILTYERVPEFSLMRPSLAAMTTPVMRDTYVRQPVLMGPEDVACLVSIPHDIDLWQVLSQYVTSLPTRPQCFYNFLSHRRRADDTILTDRHRRMTASFAEYLRIPEEL